MSKSHKVVDVFDVKLHGSKVVIEFSKWQRECNGNQIATEIRSFRKGGEEGLLLWLYSYGDHCAVLESADKRFLAFKSWNEPIAIVSAKLAQCGWKMEGAHEIGVHYAQ